MPRMISLSEWAQNEFGDLRPGSQTLARNARTWMIVPPAVKVGRHWLVDKKVRFAGELTRPVLPPDDYLKGYRRWQPDPEFTVSLSLSLSQTR